MKNTGGRTKFAVDGKYRIMELEGSVSKEVFKVEAPPDESSVVADRKGCIVLIEEGSNRRIKVHSRRVFPTSIDGCAPVIGSGDKYLALCPDCGKPHQATAATKEIVCTCGSSHPTKWLGDKPMTSATQEKKKKASKPSAEKKAKPVKEQFTPDMDALKALPNCELWRKGNVNFDHPGVEVLSYCLLFVNEASSRKYCFNTYNGTTGKRGEKLHTDEFIADEPVAGAKKERPWYAVKDVTKTKAKLEKDGYELIS